MSEDTMESLIEYINIDVLFIELNDLQIDDNVVCFPHSYAQVIGISTFIDAIIIPDDMKHFF